MGTIHINVWDPIIQIVQPLVRIWTLLCFFLFYVHQMWKKVSRISELQKIMQGQFRCHPCSVKCSGFVPKLEQLASLAREVWMSGVLCCWSFWFWISTVCWNWRVHVNRKVHAHQTGHFIKASVHFFQNWCFLPACTDKGAASVGPSVGGI